MPADIKPLFRPEAVRPKVRQFMLPKAALDGRARIVEWAQKLSAKKLKEKETELLPNFLTDVFETVLGYVGPPAAATTIRREALVQVDGKRADAGFGRFGGEVADFVAVLEGKGPNDPLDVPFAGRKRSAVEQALLYALNLRIDWYIVTNLKEIRLYCKQENQFTCERFDLQKLATDPLEYSRFVFLLGAERVVPATGTNHLSALLSESRAIGREVTAGYYDEYHDLRGKTFKALCQSNSDRPPAELLALTQKLLDRVLFIAFAEDRDLLPRDSIKRAYEHEDPYHPRPVWDNFQALFRWVDKGNPKLDIDEFNGELFKPDAALDTLVVPDDVCHGFKKLADYEYGNTADDDAAKLIDVEILGHIFEQSIADLEEMQKKLKAGTPDDAVGPSKRKREGAFYTPDFVTRYIVRESLSPVLDERFETLRQREWETSPKKKVKGGITTSPLDDPTAFDVDALNDKQTAALVRFWELWIAELETIRIVDPSCGSGAFLVEAFDQMFAAYRRAQQYLTGLAEGQTSIVDVQRSILTNNLFGMDLNGEAIEIAKLSCWIKTAEKHKKLTALNENIVRGNSVLGTPSPLVAWAERFPSVFAAGGFDVVIGNPPYVRQEWIKDIKDELKKHYASFDGTADLYVYFYELGLKLLKPGGRIGYIVTNKWLKAGYGENLRKHYGEAAWVEQVVDFGHAKQIFPDADVFPCILVARKPNTEPPPTDVRVCVIPRETLKIDDLSRQIADEGFAVPRSRFAAAPWNLEPPAVAALMDKLKANGVPLKTFAGTGPFRGVVTGCNEAFVVDTATRDKLVAEHPSSADILKKYLRGQDIDRWCSEWSGEWMIFARRGIDIDQYPAIRRHLKAFRTQLEPKPSDFTGTDWPGRKPGSYKWYELQDPVEYWREFEKPKIGYQVIQFHPSYCLDTSGTLGNDKTFFIPIPDLYLLAVLNTPLMWWYNWRTLVHLKDEALSPMGYLVEAIPIPKPTDAARARVEVLVKELIDLKGGRTAGLRAMLEWLQTEVGIERMSKRLGELVGLTVEELLAEVKKLLPKKKGLSAADLQRIKQEHATTVVPLQANARRAEQLEREVSDLVNEAFGLTPAEVKLMWDTAPPRMPFAVP